MAISNRERVGRGLDTLRDGLYPFVEREMKSIFGDQWLSEAINCLPSHYVVRKEGEEVLKSDISALLRVMWENWNQVFRNTLGRSERTLVSELRETRNEWAHTNTFSTDDAYRALDSIARLLTSISAPEADVVEKEKQAVLRVRYEDQARRETRRAAIAPTEGKPMEGLKPWREIATPHQDVASGNYQQAEFAADLWQVYLNEGSDEYLNPVEFFQRTYITEGLRQLLTAGLLRLTDNGGDPVIELQTNFGGGKTHAMLALYHLFSGVSPTTLTGIEPLLQAAEIKDPPRNVRTAVVVGNKITPGQVHIKDDGTRVHTLWGEIAWQLGGKEGYNILQAADETATNPGDTLKDLFNRYAPCLILVDEWVAYARQLHEKSDLPAGSFDTHFTFAQTLSESAKNADRTFLVVSIPSSDIEIGGDRGKEALDRLKNAIGRVESPWRPASAEESFEIVRRRLFQPIDTNSLTARDAVLRAFSEMYRSQAVEFPSECREANYDRRLRDAYPIHPELFDRLYSDWSSLDKFQRTRGVLRLMAKVIHCLWEREDKSLLIMPAHVAMDDPQVQSELTRYLDDNWLPVIDKDVDGPNSLPLSIDRGNPNFGRYSACRRVARTIYLGSAPTTKAANRGLEDRRIKIGCVQPGESVATFGDALRRLTDQATYLYLDGNRYWISTQPNVTRTATDRANQYLEDQYPVWEEIVKRLRQDTERGDFSAVHVSPESTADIPDDPLLGVRLVVLNPQHPHSKMADDSAARQFAAEILNHKGSSPRYYKNTLLFLAPDKSKLENLEKNIAQYLAWNSIVTEREMLNLDHFQSSQATSKRDQCNEEVEIILNETYQWILVPSQPDPQQTLDLDDIRLQGQESPIVRASRKLVHEEHLLPTYSATRLCLEALNNYLWRETNHIDLKQLWEYLTRYVYLPRLKDSNVLLNAISEGVGSTTWEKNFAYAEGFNETTAEYQGLKACVLVSPTLSSSNLIVKPEIARKQFEQEVKRKLEATNPDITSSPSTDNSSTTITQATTDNESPQPVKPPALKRFHGSIDLEALRMNRDTPKIAQEVIQHLTSLNGANVRITLEIEADMPEGAPDDVVRTVSENCRTLKFRNHGFEAD